MIRNFAPIARQVPEGQSAAADGAAPAADQQQGVPAQPSAPGQPGDPNVTTDATPTNEAETSEKGPASSDVQEPTPQTADDPLAPLADAVDHLANIVSGLADQVAELAARVDAIEQGGKDGGLQDEIVKQAQGIMRVAMTNLAKDFADLPAKVKAIEGKLKHF